MSYYFSIINTRDQSLFELEFGSCKQGGDGVARFSQEARKMNPFLAHGSLDFLDECQWTNNAMYQKRIDTFSSAHISAFLTPTSTRFILLHLPHPPNQAPNPHPNPNAISPLAFQPFLPFASHPLNTTSGPSSKTDTSSNRSRTSSPPPPPPPTMSATSSTTGIPNNPTSPQTEEAIRLFFTEVFELWIKAIMNPFQHVESTGLISPVFRERVRLAGKKYL